MFVQQHTGDTTLHRAALASGTFCDLQPFVPMQARWDTIQKYTEVFL